MNLENVVYGRNSVLYDSDQKSVLYEKLSNTIHVDERDRLVTLQQRIEGVDYRPVFETKTLKNGKDDPLSMLLLEVTEQCNLSCTYCIYSDQYPNERPPSSNRMSFETAKSAIDELVPRSKRNALIGFYGGEPLLNIDLIKQVMTYAKDSFPSKDLIFSMTSNFIHADKYIPDIVDNGMYVNLSLDGPRDIHDKFRRTNGGEPTYDTIISNLEKIEEYFPGYIDSHVFILSTCENPNDFERIIRFFDESKYFVSHINMSETKGKSEPVTNCLPRNNLLEEFQRRILQGEEPGILRRLFDPDLKEMALRDKEIMPEELKLNGSCYPGQKRIFVDVDGNYHPCERFGRRLKIGSTEGGIQQEVIDETVEIFADIRNELCGECWAQRVCTPCLQHAKDPKDEISMEGLSQTCEGKKSQLLTGLHNYVKLAKSDKQKSEQYIKSINPLFERG